VVVDPVPAPVHRSDAHHGGAAPGDRADRIHPPLQRTSPASFARSGATHSALADRWLDRGRDPTQLDPRTAGGATAGGGVPRGARVDHLAWRVPRSCSTSSQARSWTSPRRVERLRPAGRSTRTCRARPGPADRATGCPIGVGSANRLYGAGRPPFAAVRLAGWNGHR
jgi:hypothetical protein